MPVGHEKHDLWGGGLQMHTKPWVRARASREYWEKLKPASGRPHCPACSKPDQHAQATEKAEMNVVMDFAKEAKGPGVPTSAGILRIGA
eukprot:gene49693-29517_t